MSPGLPDCRGETGLMSPAVPGEMGNTGLTGFTGDTPSAAGLEALPIGDVEKLEGVKVERWINPAGGTPCGAKPVILRHCRAEIVLLLS